MDTLGTRAEEYEVNAPKCSTVGKPTLQCIASHAYKKILNQQREQKYLWSFNRPQEYLDELSEKVKKNLYERMLSNSTPDYVFDKITGPSYSCEHPLITKGLLASTKMEQYSGVPIEVEDMVSSKIPQYTPDCKPFHKKNRTHEYILKTVTLSDSHDGFDPRHGTPTRAQLLRNRTKYSSAPDLTYAYLAKNRMDGRPEATQQKKKLKANEHSLKVVKIEMDRIANTYRKFLIGSRYNKSQWIDMQANVIRDLMTARSRPATAFVVRDEKSKPEQRRAYSAQENNHVTRNTQYTEAKRCCVPEAERGRDISKPKYNPLGT